MTHTPGPWELRIEGEFGTVGKDGMTLHRYSVPPRDSIQSVAFLADDARLIAAAPDLLEACIAAIRYDDAIRQCGDDPQKMNSFCTAQGDTLDTLYFDWITKARAAIAAASR